MPKKSPDRHVFALSSPAEALLVAGTTAVLARLFAALEGVQRLVENIMIDRVAAAMGRRLCEVPVGFKWFVPGLLDGSFGFGGEESAGAAYLRTDGTVWTTDKDGFIMQHSAAAVEALAEQGRVLDGLIEELRLGDTGQALPA